MKACLDAVGAKITDVDHVAVGQDSDANLTKKVQYALANPAKILNFIRLRQRKEAMRDVRSLLAKALDVDPNKPRFQEHHVEHHIAHIASAYYCSPWEKAAGFSYDGSGDFVSTMMARCEGNDIEVLDRVFLPHSLGSFYTMICEFIGYKKYGDEGKVMGLAPYGKETYCEQIREIIELRNGGFQLDLNYFMPLGSNQGMQIQADGTVRLARHFSDRMVKLFGRPREPMPRSPSATWTSRTPCSIVSRRFSFTCSSELHQRVPVEDLVMAGGCALNSVANGKLFAQTPFRRTWIQPAAGDEGLAIGAALHACHSTLRQPRRYQMKNSYLGPEFSEPRIESALKQGEPGLSQAGARSSTGRGRGTDCGRQRCRLVPGTHGVGPTSAGQSLHRGPSRSAQHERHAQCSHQASRMVPSVRAFDSGGTAETNISSTTILRRSCFTSTRSVRRSGRSFAPSIMWTTPGGFKP